MSRTRFPCLRRCLTNLRNLRFFDLNCGRCLPFLLKCEKILLGRFLDWVGHLVQYFPGWSISVSACLWCLTVPSSFHNFLRIGASMYFLDFKGQLHTFILLLWNTIFKSRTFVLSVKEQNASLSEVLFWGLSYVFILANIDYNSSKGVNNGLTKK